MQVNDLSLQVLQSVSHPIRKSIVESLGLSEEPLTFSNLMWDSGLNPNFDTGPFWYHLSYLMEMGIVQKDDERYLLTPFGLEVYKILRILKRECSFSLESKEKEVKKKVNRTLQVRWATEEDMEEYRLAGPLQPKPDVVKKNEDVQKKFEDWKGPIPQLSMDSLNGAPLVVEKEGKPIVMLWVRKETRYKLIDTEFLGGEHWKGKRREEFWLFITRVWTWPSEQKEEAMREALNALIEEAKGYNIDVIEASDIYADDETVTDSFKEAEFERIVTSYRMRKTL